MGPFYKKLRCDKFGNLSISTKKCIEQSDTKLYENIYVYSLLKPVFYLKKMMNFMKMRTFYKKLPLFIKNSILHT